MGDDSYYVVHDVVFLHLFSSPRVQTLLRGLSPAYLRLGGTSADYVVFSNEPVEVFENSGVSPTLHTYNSKCCILNCFLIVISVRMGVCYFCSLKIVNVDI